MTTATTATRFQNERLGTALRGAELDGCYRGGLGGRGQRHGRGTYRFPNPVFAYTGDFVEGRKHGQGRLEIADGYYEGQFVNDEMEGQGVRVWGDGSRLTATFVMGEPSGQGVWEGPQGDRYEGHFVGYAREGAGELLLANGDKYSGGFRAHKFDGNGELVKTDGSRYAGGWTAGKRNGQGEEGRADGSTYKGEFSMDSKHGSGRSYSAATGLIYEGTFVDDKPEIAPERLAISDPPPPDISAKNPTIPEVITGMPAEWCVTAEVQFKTETEIDKPPEEEKGKKGKKDASPQDEGPYIAVEWNALEAESGRRVVLTVHSGDLTAASTEELEAAEPVPLDPMSPEVVQVEGKSANGVVTFEAFVLGRPAPDPEGDDEPVEDEPEFEPFAGGVYTIRVATEGLAPSSMKVIVVEEKASKTAKGSKAKGGKKK